MSGEGRRVVEIDGVEVCFEVMEPTNGEVAPQKIVFTPGGQGGGVDENTEIPQFLCAKGFRVLVYDRVNSRGSSGFYLGDPDADPASPQSGQCGEPRLHAYFLHELVKKIGFGPCVFWGISAGSRMSIHLAAMYPEIVTGLVLMNITAFEYATEYLATNYYEVYAAAVEKHGTMEAVLRNPDSLYVDLAANNPSNREKILNTDPELFKTRLSQWGNALRAHRGRPVVGCPEEMFKSITCPSLCIYNMGEPTDGMHTPSSAESLATALGASCRGVINDTNPLTVYTGAIKFVREACSAKL